MKRLRSRLLPALAAGALALIAGLWVNASDVEEWGVYGERDGPAGYRAVIRFDPRTDWLPAMPGQSGDRPGAVTIIAPDGTSCGTAPVDMVGAVTLDWDDAGTEITLGRPRLAAWDLEACTMRRTDLYPD